MAAARLQQLYEGCNRGQAGSCPQLSYLRGHGGRIFNVELAPRECEHGLGGGHVFASASEDDTVRVWHLPPREAAVKINTTATAAETLEARAAALLLSPSPAASFTLRGHEDAILRCVATTRTSARGEVALTTRSTRGQRSSRTALCPRHSYQQRHCAPC